MRLKKVWLPSRKKLRGRFRLILSYGVVRVDETLNRELLYLSGACCHNRRTIFMRKAFAWIAITSLLTLAACSSRPPMHARSIDVPGPQADGAIKLPNQWFLRPVGKQIVLGDFPVNIAVHPEGKFAAILHS